MDHLGRDSTTPLGAHSARSIPQPPEGPPASPALTKESLGRFHGWKTIIEQGFYDKEGFLYPSCRPTSENLEDRKEDDVVVFNYSLSRSDGNPPVEENGPSSRSLGETSDVFFQVPKNRLIESEQFNRVISPRKDPRPIESRAPLGIM